MEHWEAWCNLGGSFLAALGGLYLTYDILGGKDGPLAGVTRVVTYMAFFLITYSLGLGLKFGLITSLGMGLLLGYDLYLEARRVRAKGKPRHWSSDVILGSIRALVISIGLMSITNWRVFLILFPLIVLFINVIYLLGFSPANNRKISKRIEFRLRDLWVGLLQSIAAGLSFWAAVSLASAMAGQTYSFVPPWRVGLTIGGTGFLLSSLTPRVEWWVERLSQIRLAAWGLFFAILGFLIQAFPNWVVLLK